LDSFLLRPARLSEGIRRHRFGLAALLIPVVLRTIPEIIAGPYPIGYDTITGYVPFMRDWAAGNPGSHFEFEAGGWLLFVLFGLAYAATRIDPLTIVKISAPLLYGILGFSEYVFAEKVLKWDRQKSFLLVFIASVYFVSLRVSWDLFRNTLGLSLMLFALVVGMNIGSKKRLVEFSALVLVVAFTHLLVAALLVSLVLIQSFSKGLDIRRILPAIPAAFVIAISLIEFQAQGIAPIGQGVTVTGTLSVYAFSLYAFLPLLPMVLLGKRMLESSLIKWWLVVCVVGVILATTPLSISSQLVSSNRWTLMMFLPLTVLSAEGFSRLGKSISFRGFKPLIRMGWILLLLILFAGYVGLQAESAFPYYAYFVPTSMLQSTVPLHNSQDVVNSFQWLSANIQPGSTIIALNPIYGWAREYFTGNAVVIGYAPGTTFDAALQQTLAMGNTRIYTVWWANGQGWYSNPSPPRGFVLQHQDGQFGVFLYES
jgi:hypothetical protein